MSNVLSLRLRRLERRADVANPYTVLSDEELEARLQHVTLEIEGQVGMSISGYAAVISHCLHVGEALPDGWTDPNARAFIASILNAEKAGCSHGR